jgi:hypothetical protein
MPDSRQSHCAKTHGRHFIPIQDQETRQFACHMNILSDTRWPRRGRDLHTFGMQSCRLAGWPGSGDTMATVKFHAATILSALGDAQSKLVGKTVILSDGKAGTVENVWLDELHGL